MGREDEIRLIAYNLWEIENRPEGRQSEHWAKAEALWQEQNAKPRETLKAKPNAKRATARKSAAPTSTVRRTRAKKTDPTPPGS